MPKKFYRYEDYLTNWDYYHNRAKVSVRLVTLFLIKETLKGYWISPNENFKDTEFQSLWGKKKWVSKTSQKRYAYPTKEEAKEGFKARKNRQITILSRRLDQAKRAVSSSRWNGGAKRN